MTVESEPNEALFPERVGDKLRAARARAGLDLSDIATKTRVPLRHLTAIEAGDYSVLPSATYCIGFVKAYARTVGEDEVALASQLRAELGQRPPEDRYEAAILDDDTTGPVPTRKLAITAALIAALLIAGYLIWRNMSSIDSAPPAVASAEEQPVVANSAQPAAAPANPNGEVVLTARQPVWLRIYDATDKVLFEKEMAAGERYAVPADANKPMIRTGRADLLTVTVAGKEVPALGPAERTVKDVGISAAALAARPAAPTANTPTALAPVQP
jgi:cytoskeleton protein RodZ